MLNTINDELSAALDALKRATYALSAASCEARRQGEPLKIADQAVRGLDIAIDMVTVVQGLLTNRAAGPQERAMLSDVSSALQGLGAGSRAAQDAARAAVDANPNDFDQALRSAVAMVTTSR